VDPAAPEIPKPGHNGVAGNGSRGVLDGAFELLEVLSRAPGGAGLSELARETGLPKATTHRLLEQLLALGAAQRDGQRYRVGGTLARLGRAWQPHPALRRASLAPARTLSHLTGGAATAVCVLEGHAIRVVATSGAMTDAMHRMQTGDELVARTAAAQVLLAARPQGDPPVGYTRPEWARVRNGISRHAAVAVDHQDILPGVYCAAAAIPLAASGGVASISALFLGHRPPKDLPELMLRAARETTRNLARQ